MKNQKLRKVALSLAAIALIVVTVVTFAPVNFAQPSGPHTVTFLDWDNTQLSEQDVENGEAAVAPIDPSREGFSFDGWDRDFSSIVEDLTVRPLYSALESFTVMIQYQYEDYSSAAQPYVATVKKGFALNETVASPAINGFFPDRDEVVLDLPSVSEDHTETVIYQPNGDTSYTVLHYQQNIENKDYTLAETENLSAFTGDVVTAALKDYAGFTAPLRAPQATVAADGETTLEVYYDRDSYGIYFDVAGGSYIEPILLPFGDTVERPDDPIRTGYEFDGWTPELPATMPDEDVTLTATWIQDTEADYTVIYWLEDGNSPHNSPAYDYLGSVIETGDVDDTPEVPLLPGDPGATPPLNDLLPENIQLPSLGGYKPENYFYYDQAKTVAENTNVVEVDNSTVVNVYFGRHIHKFMFVHNFQELSGVDNNKYPGDYTSLWDAAGNEYIYDKIDHVLPDDDADGYYTFEAKLGQDISDLWPTIKVRSDFTGTFPLNLEKFHFLNHNSGLTSFQQEPVLTTNIIGYGVPGRFNYVATRYHATDRIKIPFQRMLQPIGGGSDLNDYYEDSRGVYFETDRPATGQSTGRLPATAIPGFKDPVPEEFYVHSSEENTDGTWKTQLAYYDRMKYTLTFRNEGHLDDNIMGIWYDDSLAQYDNVPENPPGKTGHVFGDWYSVPNFADQYKVDLTSETMPANGLVLYAKWEKQDHKINFDPLNGDATFTQRVQTGGLATQPEDPVRPGYTFDGWRESDKKAKFIFTNPVYKDYDIVATWKPVTELSYTVEYLDKATGNKLKDAKLVPGQMMGDTVTEKAAVVDGYLPDAVTKSLTLSASDNVLTFNYSAFEKVDYTVHYVSDSGETLAPSVVKTTEASIVNESFKGIGGYYPTQYQITLQLSANPAENEITFIYIKNNLTAYTEHHFLQNLNGVGYAEDLPEQVHSATVGSRVSAKPRSYEGFEYKDTLSVASDLVSQTGDTKLTFYYNRIELTVNFVAGANGRLDGVTTYGGILYGTPFNEAVTVPDPIPNPGYQFTGWSQTIPADDTPVEENMTFTANFSYDASQWARVFYNGNGATGGTMAPSAEMIRGTTYRINNNAFTRVGFTFSGWRTTPTGGTFYGQGASMTVAQNTTLYAQWTEMPVDPPDPPDPPTPVIPVIPDVPDEPDEPDEPTPTPPTPITPRPAPDTTAEPVAEVEIAADNSPVFRIGNADVPLFGRTGNIWALFNLLLAIVGVVISIVTVITFFVRRKEDEDSYEDFDAFEAMGDDDTEEAGIEYEQRARRKPLWRILSVLTSILAVIVFFITEDLSLPMAIFDKWTILMVVMFTAQMVFVIFGRDAKETYDEENPDDPSPPDSPQVYKV